ncbi:MAG TPA: prepilin-type N-terminal cleavage/methylation domain-containing protein [Pseudonocardiaceae bacterium]|nr:prepilin-type N-terminal cleavage/methylation domain-containing protein [Pseudonocardiaceae bacterium]
MKGFNGMAEPCPMAILRPKWTLSENNGQIDRSSTALYEGNPMPQQIRATRQRDDGFTLIELLIVIVILGVLSAVVVFGVTAFNKQGVDAACKSDMENVTVASQAYYAKNGTWATAIDDAAHTATTLVGAGFLHAAPPTNTGYTIAYTAGSGTADATISGTMGAAAC